MSFAEPPPCACAILVFVFALVYVLLVSRFPITSRSQVTLGPSTVPILRLDSRKHFLELDGGANEWNNMEHGISSGYHSIFRWKHSNMSLLFLILCTGYQVSPRCSAFQCPRHAVIVTAPSVCQQNHYAVKSNPFDC